MTLRLSFLDAMIAKGTDIGGKMQNYVSVRVLGDPRIPEDREFRTKIVQGSAKSKTNQNRVQFNDVIELPITNPNARLHVRIMDEDMTSDDICSQGFVNLASCSCLSRQQNSYRLRMHLPAKKGKNPQGGSGGDLRFTTSYL